MVRIISFPTQIRTQKPSETEALQCEQSYSVTPYKLTFDFVVQEYTKIKLQYLYLLYVYKRRLWQSYSREDAMCKGRGEQCLGEWQNDASLSFTNFILGSDIPRDECLTKKVSGNI